MITAELQGRLGNMMFQIAAIEYMGHKSGFGTAYPHVDANIEALKKPQACTSEPEGEKYFGAFKNFDWHKNLDKEILIYSTVQVPFGYIPITPRDNTHYIGYFQSELNFPDRDFILNLFKPAEYIQKRLKEYKDIIGVNKASIHVRRGDYAKLNSVYHVAEMDYYRLAMDCLNTQGIAGYLVFSNDVDWCKENFVGEQFTFIHDDALIELFLMSKCQDNVIANSAFSWWGAYLNPNPNKVVIAPKKWFNTPRHDASNIVPKSWMTI